MTIVQAPTPPCPTLKPLGRRVFPVLPMFANTPLEGFPTLTVCERLPPSFKEVLQ